MTQYVFQNQSSTCINATILISSLTANGIKAILKAISPRKIIRLTNISSSLFIRILADTKGLPPINPTKTTGIINIKKKFVVKLLLAFG